MSAELYTNGEYLRKNPHWHVHESPWKVDEILHMLSRNNLFPKTICEVGCGAGEVLRLLQQRMDVDCTFSGYEVSPQAFEICKNKANERLHFKLADFTREDCSPYDLILLMDVVEHVEDCLSFLRAVKSKGQYKIIQLPLDISVRAVLLGQIPQYREKFGHFHYFTKEIALQMLDELGYEVLDYFYTMVPTEPLPDRTNLPTFVQLKKYLGWTKRNFGRWPAQLCFVLNKDMAARILGEWRLLLLVK